MDICTIKVMVLRTMTLSTCYKKGNYFINTNNAGFCVCPIGIPVGYTSQKDVVRSGKNVYYERKKVWRLLHAGK
jgi:hypothetical protein